MELLRCNYDRNRHIFPSSTEVEVVPLKWGMDSPPAAQYDLVIGADVCYHEDGRAALCATLRDILSQSGSAARAVLAHEHRAKAGSLAAFAEAAAAHGLVCNTLHVEEGMVEDPLEASAYRYKVSVVEVVRSVC